MLTLNINDRISEYTAYYKSRKDTFYFEGKTPHQIRQYLLGYSADMKRKLKYCVTLAVNYHSDEIYNECLGLFTIANEHIQYAYTLKNEVEIKETLDIVSRCLIDISKILNIKDLDVEVNTL